MVILAAELLKRANDLVRSRIHPTTIIAGYRLAMREATKYIKTTLVRMPPGGRGFGCSSTSALPTPQMKKERYLSVRFAGASQTQAVPIDKLGREALVNTARTSLSSKILGAAESEMFANMAVDAIMSIKSPKNADGEMYPLSAIHILKAQGKSAKESVMLPGYALNVGRASQSMPLR